MSGEETERLTERAELVRPAHGRGLLAPAWRKGQSGNPTGVLTAGIYHEARKICAEHTPEAIRKQIELMRTCDDPRVVTIVTQAIIDRGAGKIRDHANDQDHGKIDLSALSANERNAMVELLKKAMGLE
jgi:hypothetical protein